MKNTYSVVLIDDSRAVNSKTEAILKEIEQISAIHSFSSAKEALLHIEHSLPDMIFLDINMPDMDGYEFLDAYIQIKSVIASNYSTRVVVVSGLVFSENLKKTNHYKHYGVNDYICKPIDKSDLEDLLDDSI